MGQISPRHTLDRLYGYTPIIIIQLKATFRITQLPKYYIAKTFLDNFSNLIYCYNQYSSATTTVIELI